MAFIDEKIFTLFSELTPLRLPAVVRHRTDQPPFDYPLAAKIDLDQARSELDRLEMTLHKGASLPNSVIRLYDGKIQERRQRLEMIASIQQGDDERTAAWSRKLFGQQRQTRTALEAELKEMLEHERLPKAHTRPVDHKMFQKMCELVFAHYRLNGLTKISRTDKRVRLQHTNDKTVVFIPQTLELSKARAARLLTHEIEVHALRRHNAVKSKIKLLTQGADHYLQAEEGLATYYQQRLTDHAWHHAPGFWDSYAYALSQEMGYGDVFETLKKARIAVAAKTGRPNPEKLGADAARRLCARLYRGIIDPGRPGLGNARGHIYRTGLITLKQTIAAFGDDVLPLLMAGKIGFHHLAIVKRLKLVPGKTPDLISREVVRQVIKG